MSSILRCLNLTAPRTILSTSGIRILAGGVKKMYNSGNFGGNYRDGGNYNDHSGNMNRFDSQRGGFQDQMDNSLQMNRFDFDNQRGYQNLGEGGFQSNQGLGINRFDGNSRGQDHFENYQGGYSRNGSDDYNRRSSGGRNVVGGTKDVLNAVMDLLGGYTKRGGGGVSTVTCGGLKDCSIGDVVEVSGQLFRRNNKFAELRDRSGIIQLICDETMGNDLIDTFKNLPERTHTTVIGKINLRPRNSRNTSIVNGDIEIEVKSFPLKDKNSMTKTVAKLTTPPNISLKRPYSTLSEANPHGITLSEYKHATSESLVQYFINRDWVTAELTEYDVGKTVKLIGWLSEHVKINKLFQHLRDGYGIIQIVSPKEEHQQVLENACNSSSLVEVKGKVSKRPAQNVNTKIPTGAIEIQVNDVRTLSPDDPYDGPVKFKKTKLEKDEIITNQTALINKFTYRTHNCSELRIKNVGEKVKLCGWVQFIRMKKFIVLRDGYGQTQILIPIDNESIHKQIDDLNFESVIRVEGTVVPRPENMKNPEHETGDIEVSADVIEILNKAKANLPMDLREHNKADEPTRLTHRYIDLRSTDMQYNLRTRSSVIMKMRECLINKFGFVEVETPTLFRRTPGGAQEFLVPSRKPGKFYSLVQSPQQFKQMLMSGAIDRYFQIARCYRDEKGRNDRQLEFTQLDIEISFATKQDVMSLMEEVVSFCWPKLEYSNYAGLEFDVLTYEEAIRKYGTDKPDTRFGWVLTNLDHIHPNTTALVLRGQEGNITNSARTKLNLLKQGGDTNEATFFIKNVTSNTDEWPKKMDQFTKNPGIGKKLFDELNLNSGDGVILGYGGNKTKIQELMGKARVTYRDILEQNSICKPRAEGPSKFLWIVDFPLFFKTSDGYESTHHPFTAPHPDDLDKLKKKEDLESIRSQAYDLVLNGNEIAGGSIRIHDAELQKMVLDDILKIPHDHMQHLLNALDSGCPPHGGIALGVDRFISIICKSNSIKDVIAFPKSSEGRDALSQAPITVSPEELKMYNIAVINEDDKMETEKTD